MGSQVHPIKVAIVVTSTRALRVGPKVGDWVKSVVDGYKEKEAEYELVDVADYKLPVFDEPLHPAMVPHMGE
jgi:NAD(P)H-dependent FMN reductase